MDDDLYEEDASIIIDFGLRFIKVGFNTDSCPRKIIETTSIFDYKAYITSASNFNIYYYIKKEDTEIKQK